MNLFWPKKKKSYDSYVSSATSDPKISEWNNSQTEFTPISTEDENKMTFQDHKDAITAASRALDAALRDARENGYFVKVGIVDPMHTTQKRFVFVDLTVEC